MILEALLWALVGAASSLSVVIPQKLVKVSSHQTAFLRVSLQFQQPEWNSFHAKWKFLTENSCVLFYAVECNTSPSSANRTCKDHVEMEGAYKERAGIEKDGSLMLKDVQPGDAGEYEIHVLALDESDSARMELVVVEGTGSDLRFQVTHQPLGSASPVQKKTAWDHSGFPTTGQPMKEGLPPRAIAAALHRSAQLPIPLLSLGHAWAFLSIKWERMGTNRSIPILVCLLQNCNGTFLEWWERACTIHTEVAGEYQRRVEVFRNGTLVIYSVGLKDTGMYQATVQTSAASIQVTVNFTVTQGTRASLCSENVSRIILAGLLLCFLGLLIGQHVWMTAVPRFPSQPRKASGDPHLTRADEE